MELLQLHKLHLFRNTRNTLFRSFSKSHKATRFIATSTKNKNFDNKVLIYNFCINVLYKPTDPFITK